MSWTIYTAIEHFVMTGATMTARNQALDPFLASSVRCPDDDPPLSGGAPRPRYGPGRERGAAPQGSVELLRLDVASTPED
jgi:hypothetical protein